MRKLQDEQHLQRRRLQIQAYTIQGAAGQNNHHGGATAETITIDATTEPGANGSAILSPIQQ